MSIANPQVASTLQAVMDNGSTATGLNSPVLISNNQSITLTSTANDITVDADNNLNLNGGNAFMTAVEVVITATDGDLSLISPGANQPINLTTSDGDILLSSGRGINMIINSGDPINIVGLQSFASDNAAGIGGILSGDLYINNSSTPELVIAIKS